MKVKVVGFAREDASCAEIGEIFNVEMINGSYHVSYSDGRPWTNKNFKKNTLLDVIGWLEEWYIIEIIEEDKMEFKKSDLVTGLHAVELRCGDFYVVVGNELLNNKKWMSLDSYSDNLKHIVYGGYPIYDVVKVYKHKYDFKKNLGEGFSGLIKTDYLVVWKEESEQDKKLRELQETIDKTAKQMEEIRKGGL